MSAGRVLLVNDDGIGAPGLRRLQDAVKRLSDDVWVVAPSSERSGASQSISLTTPLRMRRLGDREFAVDGTPVDCVVLALDELLDKPPDLVLSGVNRGPNMADDIVYSGTCGAAREAARRGIPTMALSLAVVPGGQEDWGCVEAMLPEVLGKAVDAGMAGFLNVNFPSVPGLGNVPMAVTSVGAYPVDRLSVRKAEDPRGVPYWWLQLGYPDAPREPDTDVSAVSQGHVSITPLRLDPTDQQQLSRLQQAFA
jgi:5'-nucleotidase